MRRTGLLGLLLICTLTSAMPVQAAAGVTTPPAVETVLEAEAEADIDGSTDEASLAETVSEVETEAPTQDVETAAQDTDKPELPAASANDSELRDEPAQNNDEALTANSDQEDGSELTEDSEQKDDSELIGTSEQEDTSSTSGDPVLTAQSAPEAADETITAEEDPASNGETAYTVSAESAASSVSEKAAAGVAEEINRIHFIALNGSYSDSDAILIESNGKYGLIDSSNPSKVSDDPDLAFTHDYVDTAANGLTVVKYLTDLNVSHLEFVLATHSHSDHVGGMVDIAESGLVDNKTVYIYKDYQAVMGERQWHNDYYANLALEAMKAKNAVLLSVNSPNSSALEALGDHDHGAELIEDSSEDKVGDHIEFTMEKFLIRLFNLHTESTVNENLNSIVTTIKHTGSGSGAVLMADMEQQNYMESRTIDAIIRNDKSFKADVYKVGHHGYSTSTSNDTIETLEPTNYVLSTGSRSTTPWAYTLYPYFAGQHGGKLYRTSENGSAVIADFGDRNVSMHKLVNKTVAAPVQWKPVIVDGWHMWYPDEDSYNRTGVKWTYFKSGAPVKGWFNVDSNWYFADDHYLMQTGWVTSGGNQFFLNNNGVMQTGWVKYEGKWYFMGSNGAMQTGWIKDGGAWYYMGYDGAMKTGRQVIGGRTYFFNGSGVMQTGWTYYAGKWYYLENSGAMAVNKWIGDYYVSSNGEMAVNQWVGPYYVGANGKWIPGYKKAS